MKRVTPVVAATLGLVIAAAVLGAVQLGMAGVPLAAAAALLVGGALAVLVWKVHVSTVTGKDIQRQLKLLAQQQAATPTTVPPPAPPSPAPAPVNSERSTARKLIEVGTFAPERAAASDTGRAAAATTTDPDAAFRLFAATRGAGAPAVGPTGRHAVAVVGSDALAEHLSSAATVHRLHPGMSAAELEHSRPMALVIEEDAVDAGPWVGALAPHGAQLLLELRVAMAWMRRNTGSIYVLPATGVRGLAADALRADTIVVNEQLLGSLGADPAPSLLTVLASYQKDEEQA